MIPTPESLAVHAAALLERCRRAGLTIVTAESCTGGLIAATLTEIAGSSDVFDRAFVTYSNEAKAEMLGVDAALIARDGAVSESVARAMVAGALQKSGAALAVAVTGIAGPGGGSPEKPVGLVHIAAVRKSGPTLHRRMTYGDPGRAGIRRATVADALAMLDELAT